MKYFGIIGYFVIAIIYSFIAYLVADYTASDYSYWMRVVWCGLMFSLIYLASSGYSKKASKQDPNTPLFIVFASKMFTLELISIGVCVRSYFIVADWMQVVNIITQGAIAIYLSIIAINLCFISSLEKKSSQQIIKQRSSADEIKELFNTTANSISIENIKQFNSAKELFTTTVLVVNNDKHITNLAQIKQSLHLISVPKTQSQNICSLIKLINNFYR